jgi:hypothetical protein
VTAITLLRGYAHRHDQRVRGSDDATARPMAVGMWRRWRSARGADGGGVADCDAGTINVRTDIVILLFLVINNNHDGSAPAHFPGMRCWPAPCMHS